LQIADFTIPLKSGAYQSSNAIGNNPDISYGGWQHLFVVRHSNDVSDYQLQLSSSYSINDRLFFRKLAGGLEAMNPTWIELATRGTNSFIGDQIITGNVGIGTVSPEAKLDVNGNIQSNGGANQFYGFGQSSSAKPIDVRSGSHYPYVFNWHTGLTFSAHSAYGGIRFYNQGYPDMYGTGVLVMSITNNNVGIGTTNPDSKLTVNGTIHATEVKVTQTVPADYVFQKYYTGKSELKPEYHLPTLTEVEKFTKDNHHLPNVPSAAEIKENGLLLGEMSNILLQKIEELTLYSIEQQKTIEKQTTVIEKLEERLNRLETALETKR
jgi:hypothetical protein